jgi:hypothetical protein
MLDAGQRHVATLSRELRTPHPDGSPADRRTGSGCRSPGSTGRARRRSR